MGMTPGARRRFAQLQRAQTDKELKDALEALKQGGIGCLAELQFLDQSFTEDLLLDPPDPDGLDDNEDSDDFDLPELRRIKRLSYAS